MKSNTRKGIMKRRRERENEHTMPQCTQRIDGVILSILSIEACWPLCARFSFLLSFSLFSFLSYC